MSEELQATEQEKALAARIAKSLKEPNADLIENVVVTVGLKKSAQIFKKAITLYKAGELTRDGSKRKRTAGGCFFYAAKNKLNKEQRIKAGIPLQRERDALEKAVAEAAAGDATAVEATAAEVAAE